MYDAIMLKHQLVHYRMYMRRTIEKLIYHICMHVDHLYHERFHAEVGKFVFYMINIYD